MESKAARHDQDGFECNGTGRDVAMPRVQHMEETPMENHDKKMFEETLRKDANLRPHLSCRTAFVDYIPAPEFPATVSLVSSENDIDILNTV